MSVISLMKSFPVLTDTWKREIKNKFKKLPPTTKINSKKYEISSSLEESRDHVAVYPNYTLMNVAVELERMIDWI